MYVELNKKLIKNQTLVSSFILNNKHLSTVAHLHTYKTDILLNNYL